MPKLLTVISVVGTAAMLWVGGHILLVGVDDLGWHPPYDAVHHLEEAVHDALGALGAVAGWLVNTFALRRRRAWWSAPSWSPCCTCCRRSQDRGPAGH